MPLEFTIHATEPAQFLAWDDAFLDSAESGAGGEALWFWESPTPFIVVGYGQSLEREVDLPSARELGLPIFRRCSGGGTVVQGPGCINYALVLAMSDDGPLATITGANAHIMERNRRALANMLPDPVVIRGHTDLAVNRRGTELKFSGNAQRRRRHFLLFHGTILTRFDVGLVGRVLRFPSKVPDYRAGRTHGEFVANTGLDRSLVEAALRAEWKAQPAPNPAPVAAFQSAWESRYSRPEWHARIP